MLEQARNGFIKTKREVVGLDKASIQRIFHILLEIHKSVQEIFDRSRSISKHFLGEMRLSRGQGK